MGKHPIHPPEIGEDHTTKIITQGPISLKKSLVGTLVWFFLPVILQNQALTSLKKNMTIITRKIVVPGAVQRKEI